MTYKTQLNWKLMLERCHLARFGSNHPTFLFLFCSDQHLKKNEYRYLIEYLANTTAISCLMIGKNVVVSLTHQIRRKMKNLSINCLACIASTRRKSEILFSNILIDISINNGYVSGNYSLMHHFISFQKKIKL